MSETAGHSDLVASMRERIFLRLLPYGIRAGDDQADDSYVDERLYRCLLRFIGFLLANRIGAIEVAPSDLNGEEPRKILTRLINSSHGQKNRVNCFLSEDWLSVSIQSANGHIAISCLYPDRHGDCSRTVYSI